MGALFASWNVSLSHGPCNAEGVITAAQPAAPEGRELLAGAVEGCSLFPEVIKECCIITTR